MQYTINTKFPNVKDKDELIQDCSLETWKQIQRGKINKESNIFSFLMGRASFSARDKLRKDNRRSKKVRIISCDNDMMMTYINNQYIKNEFENFDYS